jgi:6-phosphogluconolactonase
MPVRPRFSLVLLAGVTATLSLAQGCKEIVVVSPPVSMVPLGWTQQFSAKKNNGSAAAVSWTVNGVIGGSAEAGTISTTGFYSSPKAVPTPASVAIGAVSRERWYRRGSASLRLTGLFVYVSHQQHGRLTAYSIGPAGDLVPLANPAIVAGREPFFLASDPSGTHLYVTDILENAVYIYSIDPRSGALTLVGSPVKVGSAPRSFAIDRSGKFLYLACINEAGIYGFNIDSTTGALTPLLGSPFPNSGSRTAAIALDPSGEHAFVPNNASKNVSVFSVNPKTGQLAFAENRYAGVAPAWAIADKSSAHLYVLSDVDDTIYAYSIDATGALTPLSTPAFHDVADPLSATLGPEGRFLYVPNWSSNSGFPANTVSVFSIDPVTGVLVDVPGSPFATGAGPSFIAFEPFGKFAYVANELAGTLAGFSVDSATGAIKPLPNIVAASGLPTMIAIVTTHP